MLAFIRQEGVVRDLSYLESLNNLGEEIHYFGTGRVIVAVAAGAQGVDAGGVLVELVLPEVF